MALDVVVTQVGPLISLDEAKAHLNVDGDGQDELIKIYADAAVQSCMTNVDRALVPVGAEPSFKVAALLMLGDLYANRETIIVGEAFGVSPTVDALLRPFRIIRV